MEHCNHSGTNHPVSDGLLLIVFWTYVGVPLGWGIFSTLKKAMALFY